MTIQHNRVQGLVSEETFRKVESMLQVYRCKTIVFLCVVICYSTLKQLFVAYYRKSSMKSPRGAMGGGGLFLFNFKPRKKGGLIKEGLNREEGAYFKS